MSQYDKNDPRVWKNPNGETNLNAFYLHSSFKSRTSFDGVNEPEEKENNNGNEEEKMTELTKLCKKRNIFKNAIAVTATAAAVAGITNVIVANNMQCRTVDRAVELGWDLESQLAIPKNVYSNLKTLNAYMKSKSEIDTIADLYIDNAEDILACKIASLFEGREPNDVYFKYGLTSLNNRYVNEAYIQIGDVIYIKGEGKGENIHKADDKIINCIDNIVKIQEIAEYYDYSPMYSSENDDDKIYKELEDAVEQLNKTAACIFKIDENGNIVAEVIKGKPQEKEDKESSKIDDEPEIGD